jgi:hypothetical protein
VLLIINQNKSTQQVCSIEYISFRAIQQALDL